MAFDAPLTQQYKKGAWWDGGVYCSTLTLGLGLELDELPLRMLLIIHFLPNGVCLPLSSRRGV